MSTATSAVQPVADEKYYNPHNDLQRLQQLVRAAYDLICPWDDGGLDLRDPNENELAAVRDILNVADTLSQRAFDRWHNESENRYYDLTHGKAVRP